ncbi:MAG: DNA polymerase III subunit beta [Spirochaetota bacterium]|nr:DNA polymerase III subunit beta [Spirochaetota bacterium]
MKIEVDKDQLLKSLNIADSVISSKNINTAISNCLFNVIKDEIEIVSTDNEIGIRTRIDAKSDFEDSFTVDGKIFTGILKELPKGHIKLEISESYLIEMHSSSSDIKGYSKIIGKDASEFPDLPILPDDNAIEIENDILKEMIRKVIYAAAKDTTKPVFHGIFMSYNNQNNLTMVATDSRRLSIASKPIEGDVNLEEGIILPLKAANELFRLLENEGRCKFILKNNQCFFNLGRTELMSRIVDGQFPNYKQVIPVEFIFKALVQKNRLMDSLRRAIIFTREPSYKIILHFKKDVLTIEAKTPELGESIEEIPIESDSNEEISIGLNAQFIMDSIKEIDSHSVIISITGSMSPVAFSPEDDNNYLSVIMPIKMK